MERPAYKSVNSSQFIKLTKCIGCDETTGPEKKDNTRFKCENKHPICQKCSKKQLCPCGARICDKCEISEFFYYTGVRYEECDKHKNTHPANLPEAVPEKTTTPRSNEQRHMPILIPNMTNREIVDDIKRRGSPTVVMKKLSLL